MPRFQSKQSRSLKGLQSKQERWPQKVLAAQCFLPSALRHAADLLCVCGIAVGGNSHRLTVSEFLGCM